MLFVVVQLSAKEIQDDRGRHIEKNNNNISATV